MGAFLSSFQLGRSLYNPLIGAYTKGLYKDFFESLPQDGTVLDIGIGNGYAICHNADLVKQKQLKITGVDICEKSLRDCAENVKKDGLEDHISLTSESLAKLAKDGKKWKYIYLSNSYSVIENVCDLLEEAFGLLEEDGELVISLTLFDNYNPIISYFKPRLKHVLGFDCGRYITHSQLDKELNTHKIVCKDKKLMKDLPGTSICGYTYANLYSIRLSVAPIFPKDCQVH